MLLFLEFFFSHHINFTLAKSEYSIGRDESKMAQRMKGISARKSKKGGYVGLCKFKFLSIGSTTLHKCKLNHAT